jgi:hypothetical protein
VDLDDGGCHLSQLVHVLLRGGTFLAGVAGVTDEHHDGDAAVYGVGEDGQDRFHPAGGPRRPHPDRVLRGVQVVGERVVELPLVVDIGDPHVLGEYL